MHYSSLRFSLSPLIAATAIALIVSIAGCDGIFAELDESGPQSQGTDDVGIDGDVTDEEPECLDHNDCDEACVDGECVAFSCGDGFVRDDDGEICDDGDENDDHGMCADDCQRKMCIIGEDHDSPGEALADEKCMGIYIPEGDVLIFDDTIEISRPFRIEGAGTARSALVLDGGNIIARSEDISFRKLAIEGDTGGLAFAIRVAIESAITLEDVEVGINRALRIRPGASAQIRDARFVAENDGVLTHGGDVTLQGVEFIGMKESALVCRNGELPSGTSRNGTVEFDDVSFRGPDDGATVSRQSDLPLRSTMTANSCDLSGQNLRFIDIIETVQINGSSTDHIVPYIQIHGGTATFNGLEVQNIDSTVSTVLNSVLPISSFFYLDSTDVEINDSYFNNIQITGSGHRVVLRGLFHLSESQLFVENTEFSQMKFEAEGVGLARAAGGVVYAGPGSDVVFRGVTAAEIEVFSQTSLLVYEILEAFGGVYASEVFIDEDPTSLAVINSTFSGNQVHGFWPEESLNSWSSRTRYGGAIYVRDQNESEPKSTVALRNATITENDANNGGGIYISSSDAGNVDISSWNSILSGNTCTGDFEGPRPSTSAVDCRITTANSMRGGYNLLGEDFRCEHVDTETTRVGDELALESLAENGGPTRTHALGDDSPARGNGEPGFCRDVDDSRLHVDQRGVGRSSTVCDIGAWAPGQP